MSIELCTTAVVEIRGGPREGSADHHKCLLQRLAAVRFYKVDDFDLEKAFDGGAGQA